VRWKEKNETGSGALSLYSAVYEGKLENLSDGRNKRIMWNKV